MKYVCIVLYLLSGINVNTGQHTQNTCLSTSCAYNYKQSIEEYRCYTNYNCPTDYICCEHACFFHKICIPLNKEVDDNLISVSTPDPKLVFEISSSGGATCPNTYCLNDWKEWNEELRCYKHHNCKEYELCCNHDCYGHKICLDPVKSVDLPNPLPESSNICRNTKCSIKHKITNIKYQCIFSWDCKSQYNCCNHDCFNHKICIRWNKGEPPTQIDNSSIDNFTTESDNSYPEDTTEMPNISVTFSPSLTSTTTTSEDNYLSEWSGSGNFSGNDDEDGVDKNDDDDEVDVSHKTVTTQRLPNSSTLNMNISEDDDNINNYSDDDDDASKSTDKTPFSTAVVPSTIINTNVSNPFDDDIEESSGSGDSDEEINEDDDDNGKDESTSKEILTSNTLTTSTSKVTTADNEETEVINNSVQYTTVTSITTNVSNSFDNDIEESSGSGDSDEEINEDDDDNGKDESTSKEILISNTLTTSTSKVTTADNEETEVINNSVQYTTVTSITTNVSNSFDNDIEESSGSGDSDEEINEDDDDNGKDESTSKEILTSNTLTTSTSKVTTADNEETEVINNSVQYTTVTSITTNVSNSFDNDIEESSGSGDSDEEINEDDDDNGKDESTSKEILISNTLTTSTSKVTTADNEETEVINNSVQYTTVTSITTNVSNSFDNDIEESSGSGDSDEEINEDDDDNGKDESTSKEILTSNTLTTPTSKVTTADNEETEVINNSVQYTTVTSITTNVSNSFDNDILEISGSGDSDEEINEDDDDNGKDESTSKEILTSNTLTSTSKVTTVDNEETEVINNSVQYTTVTSITTNVSNSFDNDILEISGSGDSDEEINEDDDDNGKDESTSKEILTSNTLTSTSKVTTVDNEETEVINNSVQYTTVTSDVATTAELMDSKSIEHENNEEIISSDENGNTDNVEDDIIKSEGDVTSVILPQEIMNLLSNITDDIIEKKFPAPTIPPTLVEVSSYENGSTEGASFLTITVDNISSKDDVSEETGSGSKISDTNDDDENSDDEDDTEHPDIKHSMQSMTQTLNFPSEADSWNEKEKSSTVTTSTELNDLNASISEKSGSGSGSGIEDTEGNDDDIEDNENGSGSVNANPNLNDDLDKGSVRPPRDSKINLPDYNETVQSWCRDINCTKAKLLPSDVLQLISMNPNTALSYEPTDFVEEDETWYSNKDSNLKFMVDEKSSTLTTVLDELICPGQLIHDTNLLCHGTWNCIKSYHCRHHPCYSHKVCMNKRVKVQECPTIQEMCDDPLVLMELKYLICESAFDCSEPNIFKNNYNIYDQMENRKNMKIGCCEHECLPRHKICRKTEDVLNFKEMMHSMEIASRNIANPAMNRALIMNLIFMVIAGLVYLWLYLKK